jgi:hypothetical protein
MDMMRNWIDSVEQATMDDYGYRPVEAAKLTGVIFSDAGEDGFDGEEPDFSDFDA